MPDSEAAVKEILPDQIPDVKEGGADQSPETPVLEHCEPVTPPKADPAKKGEGAPAQPGSPPKRDPTEGPDAGFQGRGSSRAETPDEPGQVPGHDSAETTTQATWAESIKKLWNFGKVGSVNYFGLGFAPGRASDAPVDPTREYPPRPGDLPKLASAEDIATWELELRNRRILVLGCLHAKALQAFTYDLLEAPLLSGHKRQLLNFNLLKGNQEADLALHSLAEIQVGDGSACVIVVSLQSKRFLESMFLDLDLVTLTREMLVNKETYLLLRASEPEILNAFGQKLEECDEVEDDPRYFFARVGFLGPMLLLSRHFSKERACHLARQIEEQWITGLWGKSRDEIELLHWVSKLLKEGPQRLEEQVEVRALAATGEGAVEFLRASETIDASELFAKADDVGRTVLYAVAKFPGLHPHEFERLMSVLLARRTAEIEVTEEELDAEGSVRKVTRKRTRDLMDLWREAPDGALAACHVQAVEQEDGSDVIDFVAPYLRRDLLRTLRQYHPLYLRQRLERILEAGLLFEENGRSRLREGAIGLTVEIALADPGRFDERWLTRHVLRLEVATGVELNDPETEGVSEGEFLQLFVKLAENAELRRRVLSGLSDLIREMLRHDRLQPLVEAWLDGLLRSRRHDQALVFVLDIFKALRFTPRFDVLHWFRRLLDETPDDSRDEVYKALLRSAIDLKLRIYELLEPLADWLPDPGGSDPPKRPSTRYALQLMVDYCFHTLREVEAETAGVWPSSYPLFAVLREDAERTDARLRMLVEWLLHPSMRWIAEEEDADALVESLWTFRAAVLEEWYWVLQGDGAGDGGEPDPAASSVADGLLNHLLALTSLEDRSRLLECWRTWRAGYLDEAGSSGDVLSEPRRYAKLRRSCSMRLEKRLKELHLERKRGSS